MPINVTSISDKRPKYLDKSGEFVEKEIVRPIEVEEEKAFEEKKPLKPELGQITEEDKTHIVQIMISSPIITDPQFKGHGYVEAIKFLHKKYEGTLKDKSNLCKKIYSEFLGRNELPEDAFIYG